MDSTTSRRTRAMDAADSDPSSGRASPCDGDSGMRVGPDYQAVIPDCLEISPEGERAGCKRVWIPSDALSAEDLDAYIRRAKSEYKYEVEQALGMLYWHKYDLESALTDLRNFTPYPSGWVTDDKVLFEQAFNFHGKSFQRIHEMLPDKSIKQLVKYYYTWKKTRSHTSLLDKRVRGGGTAQMDMGSSSEESDMDMEGVPKRSNSRVCAHCAKPAERLYSTVVGSLCDGCFDLKMSHGPHTGGGSTGRRRLGGSQGVMGGSSMTIGEEVEGLAASGAGFFQSKKDKEKEKVRPPKNMNLDPEDIKLFTSGGEAGQESIDVLKKQVEELKTKVQEEAQRYQALRARRMPREELERLRPLPVPPTRITNRWTNEELLLAVLGTRRYGRDYSAIAEIVRTKTVQHVQSFFLVYAQRYKLDEVLAEHDAEVAAMAANGDREMSAGRLAEHPGGRQPDEEMEQGEPGGGPGADVAGGVTLLANPSGSGENVATESLDARGAHGSSSFNRVSSVSAGGSYDSKKTGSGSESNEMCSGSQPLSQKGKKKKTTDGAEKAKRSRKSDSIGKMKGLATTGDVCESGAAVITGSEKRNGGGGVSPTRLAGNHESPLPPPPLVKKLVTAAVSSPATRSGMTLSKGAAGTPPPLLRSSPATRSSSAQNSPAVSGRKDK